MGYRLLCVFLVVLVGGCATTDYMKYEGEQFRIEEAPNELVELQVREDYLFLKAVFALYPHKELTPLWVFIDDKYSSGLHDGKVKESYKNFIFSKNSRGIWVHELIHYFSFHIKEGRYDKVSIKEEFACEVIENYINGVGRESFSKNFVNGRE